MASLGLFIAVLHIALISGFSSPRFIEGTKALVILLYVGALSLMWYWWGSAAYKASVIVL